MPEQPPGAPSLPDDFDESQPGLPFRKAKVVDPRAGATPLGTPGAFMTDPAVAAAQQDWMGALPGARMVPDPANPGMFVEAGSKPTEQTVPGVKVVE